MPTAIKRQVRRKPALQRLRAEVMDLRARVEDLEDLTDLNAAIVRNSGKAGVPWKTARKTLGLS
jgi:cell division protein FtsB